MLSAASQDPITTRVVEEGGRHLVPRSYKRHADCSQQQRRRQRRRSLAAVAQDTDSGRNFSTAAAAAPLWSPAKGRSSDTSALFTINIAKIY